jgi:outer membrane protein TolC
MRTIQLISSFLIAGFSTFAQESRLTLEHCQELALLHSPLAEQAVLIQQTASNQIKLLNRSQVPQLGINGQATWQSEVTHISVPIPGIEITPPPKDQYKATLDVNQSVWDGGVIQKQKKTARAGQQVEEQRLAVELYSTRELVTSLFFGALLAGRQEQITRSLEKELESNISRMKASVENGIAIEANTLSLEAKMLETEQQILLTQKNKQSALEALSLLCGIDITPATELVIPSEIASSDENFHRPELAYFDAQRQSLKVNEELIRAKNLPKLSVFATGGYGRPSLNFLSTSFNPYFIGGVQLRIPLSHWYTQSQSIELQQLRINRERIDAQQKNFLLASKVKLTSQNREVERLRALVTTDQKLIALRSRIKETAETQLYNGVITSTDYLTEINNEEIALQNEALHQIQLVQAIQSIQLTKGY